MPKVVDSEAYRQELLHKCFDLFADKGYANVTTRQIAKELGISTGAMYHYFPSKPALFEQLVEEVTSQDVRLLNSLPRDGTLAERIERLGELLIENEEYLTKQAAIWTDFSRNHPSAEIGKNPAFQEVDRRYHQALAELLDLSDPKLVEFIWTLINGILLDRAESDRTFSFSEQIHLLTQMLIAYCEKHL
jgi:AcrR family transcriptional regulator